MVNISMIEVVVTFLIKFGARMNILIIEQSEDSRAR